jgi:hypothetical protein
MKIPAAMLLIVASFALIAVPRAVDQSVGRS